MISDHIDQVQRALLFRAEPQRVRRIGGANYEVRGDNRTEQLHHGDSGWECTCADFWRTKGRGYPCAHVIALYRLLNDSPELAN